LASFDQVVELVTIGQLGAIYGHHEEECGHVCPHEAGANGLEWPCGSRADFTRLEPSSQDHPTLSVYIYIYIYIYMSSIL
jgi:hypothetical protein